jgi:hypothetical protein
LAQLRFSIRLIANGGNMISMLQFDLSTLANRRLPSPGRILNKDASARGHLFNHAANAR